MKNKAIINNLWIDNDNMEEVMYQKTKDTELIKYTKLIVKDGFIRLEKALKSFECDAIIEDFDSYCSTFKDESDSHTLKTGLHSRLCNFHLTSINASSAIVIEKIMKLLDFWFDDEAAVCTSLFFEQSTEQAIHRDSPFFCTEPYGLFFGVWFALEDIKLEAGPLNYYPGLHKDFIDRYEIGKLIGSDGRPYEEYIKRLNEICSKSGIEKKVALIKKGDAFIWHPELPHGGGPITTPGKTRKSIVFHCIPKTKSVYGVDEFFGHKPYDGRTHSLKSMNKLKRINSWNHFLKKIFKKKKNSEILNSGRFMIDHGEPKFDVNF